MGESRASGRTRLIVLGLFLFSGMSGLIYEVVWSRLFTLVLGTTVYAIATVLAVFMGGLALGSWLFGKIADRPDSNCLRIYGLLEIGIGVFGVILPLLIGLSDLIYRAMWPLVADSFALLMMLRVLLAVLILIVPSVMMGATLPVLARFLVRTRAQTGRDIGTLYAINTLGAVIGCFCAGFLLIELMGVRMTLWTAALLNFAVGTGALLWSKRDIALTVVIEQETRPEPTTRRAPMGAGRASDSEYGYSPMQVRVALMLYALSGFAALALEVLWTRSLLYFTSVDTWAFTAMLTAFLCGIGLGSLVMARLVSWIRHPLPVLGVIEVLVGVSAAASIPLLSLLYGAFATVAEAVSSEDEATLFGKIVTKLFASFFIMLVPTLLMGAAFPLISAIYVGARTTVGRGIGTLYALNTVGAIVGSVVAGFILIPRLGLQQGILLCASVFVLAGLILCVITPRRPTPRLVTIGVSALLVLGVVLANLSFESTPVIAQSKFFKNPDDQHKLLFNDEGPAASLAVLENRNGVKLLNINGITTAINNYMDMQVHRMLSHLPLLLHPDPKSVLIVGFGMGSTPWGCTQHEVDRVDVVELLRSERLTASLFADINHGVLDHPKLNFIVGDGRNYLLGTREKYDVISFNAIHPRYSANLYTEDFYRLCRERLSEDGVICAWMTQDSMTQDEFRMLCRAFVDVFPHSSLWYCNPGHFCLIGTIKETRVDLEDWQRRMYVDKVRRDLADSNLDNPFVLAGRYMFGGQSLIDYVAGAPLNTDDRPRIEFSRETKRQERLIIDDLIQRSESVKPIVVFSSSADTRAAQERVLEQYERSTDWLERGQTDYWYPHPGAARPLLPEIGYRRALLEAPANHDVRHNLRFSKLAERDARRLLRDDPQHGGAMMRLGVILLEKGQLAQAEELFNSVLKMRPDFLPAAAYLGYLYLFQGRLEEAIPTLLSVIQTTGPNDARTMYVASVTLARRGNAKAAAEWRERALALDPDVTQWFSLWEQTINLLGGRSVAPNPNEAPASLPSPQKP